MKRVIIESPFRGENAYQEERNRRYAMECMKDSLQKGEAPFLSHLLYTQVLNEAIPEERELGITTGFVWGEVADITAVYFDNGVTEGMKQGIVHAIKCGRVVEYRQLNGAKVNVDTDKSIKLKSILQHVSDYFGFHPEIIKQKSRHRVVVDARHIFCTLAKELYPEISGTEIGKIINCDHATVTYAISEVYNVKEKREKYNAFCAGKKIALCHPSH